MNHTITPKSDDAITQRFPGFIKEVRGRLDKGREAYGDSSFNAPLETLLGEIKAECLDLAGWGFCLYARICILEENYQRQEKMIRMYASDIVMEETLVREA